MRISDWSSDFCSSDLGGAGFDSADYSGSGAAVTVDLVAGTGAGGDAQGDRLQGVERLIGSRFGDEFTGDGFDNVLIGAAGADRLTGGAGIEDRKSTRLNSSH